MNVFTSKVDKDNVLTIVVDLNQDRINSNPSKDKSTGKLLIKSERIMSLGSPQVVGVTGDDQKLPIKVGLNIFAQLPTPIEVGA
mgnify:CR=1 FL=1